MSTSSKDPISGKGFIYILSNPSMPNLYKVGLTTNSVKQRIQELNSTGVPRSFHLAKKYEIREDKLLAVERHAHRKLTAKGLHHGKEFFEGPIHVVEAEVEDAIFEIAGETAIDLVGEAAKRKAESELKAREEKDFQRKVQDRLIKENQVVDEQRRKYLLEKDREIKSDTSFLDTYVWVPLGFMFFAAIGLALLTTGPIGWIVVGAAGWWIYNEDHVKPKQNLEEEAARIFPYKTSSEVAVLLRTESYREENSTTSYTSTYPFRTTASRSSPALSTASSADGQARGSSLKAIQDRVDDEIKDLAKRDPGLWFECYQETKSISKRSQLYQTIRKEYLTKKMIDSLPLIAPSNLYTEIDKIPHMSSYQIEGEIKKAINS